MINLNNNDNICGCHNLPRSAVSFLTVCCWLFIWLSGLNQHIFGKFKAPSLIF